MPLVALLGPQRLHPTVGSAVKSLGIEGRVAAITSGWEERELEDDELSEHLGRRTVNLRLYHRYEEALSTERDLLDAIHAHIDRLARVRELYRTRLTHEMAAARTLLGREGDDDDLQRARAGALDAVRRLDTEHLQAVARARREFAESSRWPARTSVLRHRKEIAGLVRECTAIAIAGGHVARLLDHLRLFDLPEFMRRRPVIAWSAGAMVLAPRVVLFHDSPPQGPDNAEVHDEGLDLIGSVIPLPHARRRLRLGDPARVAVLARRFAPARCIAMDEQALLIVEDERVRGQARVRRLAEDGTVETLPAVEPAVA